MRISLTIVDDFTDEILPVVTNRWSDLRLAVPLYTDEVPTVPGTHHGLFTWPEGFLPISCRLAIQPSPDALYRHIVITCNGNNSCYRQSYRTLQITTVCSCARHLARGASANQLSVGNPPNSRRPLPTHRNNRQWRKPVLIIAVAIRHCKNTHSTYLSTTFDLD